MVVFLDRIIGKIKSVIYRSKDNIVPFYTKDIFKDMPYVIGEHTYGKPKVLHWGEDVNLYIGKYCSIAENVTIFLGGNHRTDWITTYPFNVLGKEFRNSSKISGHPATKGDVIIGNDVWIANGAVILSGVTIGNGAVVAANAVVTKNVPSYAIVAGNPAVVVKMRFEQTVINNLEKIAWWNWSTQRINENLELLCSGKCSDFIKKNAYEKF